MTTKRFDWSNTFSKISTWLGLLSAAGVPGLVTYATLPDRAQALLPDWTLVALAAMVMIPAMCVGIATAYQQKGLAKKKTETVTVAVTTEVVDGGVGSTENQSQAD